MEDINKWATIKCIKVVFKQFIMLKNIIKLVVVQHLQLFKLMEQKFAELEAKKLKSILELYFMLLERWKFKK